ncbi:MAG: flagellar basal body L-ring protein FlgH [Gammaproteobacteria bacterium]|nr:flagellar basal body L-ring protein FlgH [Gammaproteobacteria bacterium]
MNRFSLLISMVIVSGSQLMTGCATAPPELSEFEPIVRPVAPAKPRYNNGSLFQARSISLFEDQRPYSIGDILTINLNESTSASKKAATSTKKDDTVSLGTTVLGGRTPTRANGNEIFAVELAPSRAFDGEGDSSQSNSLNGQITVTVVDILPNGNLVVQGEKWFTLNQGKEYIRLAGIVRPQDVQPDNTVTSSKLADAQIAYSGEGFVADSNTQGWLTQFFSSKWWPF